MKSSRSFAIVAVAALIPVAAAFAQSPTPDDRSSPPKAPQGSQQGSTFESLDTDSDGRISKTEAASSANVTANFAHYDKNGDGFIERDEVTSANNRAPEASKQ